MDEENNTGGVNTVVLHSQLEDKLERGGDASMVNIKPRRVIFLQHDQRVCVCLCITLWCSLPQSQSSAEQ